MTIDSKQEFYYKRMLFIVVAWHEGKAMEEIGSLFGLTRERVRQIIMEAEALGVRDPKRIGGAQKSAAQRKADLLTKKKQRLAYRIEKMFGCSMEEFRRHNDGLTVWRKWQGNNNAPRAPRAYYYFMQKRAAISFAAGWNLTFPEWCKVWDESGMWSHHGRGGDKVTLARIDTSLPFQAGNVVVRRNRETNARGGKIAWSRWYASKAVNMKSAGEMRSTLQGFMAKQEECFRLHDVEGLPYSEVAKRLGLKLAATASGYACAARARARRAGAEVNVYKPAPPMTKVIKENPTFPAGSLGARSTTTTS